MATTTAQIERQNFRRDRATLLGVAILNEIARDVPAEYMQDIHDALMTVLERNGACIMTDKDRVEMKLEPRDALGWTQSEQLQYKTRMIEDLYAMQAIYVPSQQGSE